ncbi:prominin-2 [Cynoglossus semilaevis]|uniref:Prominin-2-like n=1 Tax=Cynoglossus semilaevis TaxID=244447 RepID=A0A3P8VJC4_CYNSE|nr:prominin-2-like [Cynoglossus semilaevis]XP_024916535.1 prominin-2-like [Cynoglossus semilaevis]XP_024916536.1 prominin-2-like [Cynoglossus semilaevis]XP_024916537.1 prominin-2-like [Cynoglossus semilaevis]XP_024916538.1 prominin-2-like [Cynoglossus semilaevis]
MGENMRVWRSKGSHASLRLVVVGVMLLTLAQSGSVPPQTVCGGLPHQNVTQPEYVALRATNGSGDVMADLVGPFLNVVQPKPFPRDLFFNLTNAFTSETPVDYSRLQSRIVAHFTGFWIGAGILLAYVVLMPILGLILACCRCCGNCGGRMYQEKTNSLHCERRTFYWVVLITSVFILAGNVYMFINNQAFKDGLDQTPTELNSTLTNVLRFTEALPEQISSVVNESNTTLEAISRNLDDVGRQLGGPIQEKFRSYVDPVLQSLLLLDRETRSISTELQSLNSSLTQLQSSMDRMQENVTQVKDIINNNIHLHQNAEISEALDELTEDNYQHVPNLNEFQSAVDEVVRKNLTSTTKEVENSFNNIPQTVERETSSAVQQTKQALDGLRGTISDVASKFNEIDFLQKLSDIITTEVYPNLNRFTPAYRTYTDIWWKCGFAVCSLVLLVVLCNCMGLFLGVVGLKPKVEPTMRSQTSNCGGTFFLAGSGFSFIFSWILMIVVLVLFFVTGNIYTLVCRPLRNGKLLEAVDSTDYISNLGQSLGFNVNISVKGIYSDCKDNKPLWTTLQLHEVINLDEIMNVSQYVEQAQQLFDSTHINLSSVTLLEPDVDRQLRDFSTKARSFNSTDTTHQIAKMSRINLNSTADKLDQLGSQNEASNLRGIQATYETTIIPQLENVNVSVRNLQSNAENISGEVEELLRNLEAAQTFLRTNTTQIIRTESRKFLDCQIGHIISYKEWASSMITQQIGRCQPVAGMVDFVDVVFCSSLVEPMNLFWSSLLWCLVFFIPSIIFSILLAKYYRRMKHS